MKTINNPDRVAWIWSISASIIVLVLTVAIFYAGAKSVPATPKLNSEQTDALRRRIMLQARVQLCEMREKGELPKSSQACDESEKKKLDEYRKEISEIDHTLRTASGGKVRSGQQR